MIKQYVKKPIPIMAIHFTGDNVMELLSFVNNNENIGYDEQQKQYYIKTLEGNHYITNGDYIIQGVEGEYYPCKQAIFEKTYTEITK